MNADTGLISCSIEKAEFLGWNAVYLRNNLVSVVAVPDIGGRLMAYNLHEYPFLYVDPDLAGKLFTPQENQGDGSLAAWKNYGGDKTWPAPQGWDDDSQWHGPPDPILDSGRYRLERAELEAGKAVVVMVSPPDSRTGIQITRQVTLYPNSTRVQLVLTFTNVSNHILRWSIWDVVQLRAERTTPEGETTFDPGCLVTTPLNPHSCFNEGFNIMFGKADNPQWTSDPQQGLFIARYLWEIGKVGLDSPAGWIAFNNTSKGKAFVERFSYFPDQEYPDQGASVECWTVGKGTVANLDYENSGIYLMETEVLSPLYQIEPGKKASFTLEWNACSIDGKVVGVSEAGCDSQPFKAIRKDTGAHITGTFGVFDPGDLRLAWLDLQGNELTGQSLGLVSPLENVRLDQQVAIPEHTHQAVLILRANDQDYHLSRTFLDQTDP